MKRIVIMRENTKCSDVIGYTGEGAKYYSWASFINQARDVNWLGFSKREVQVLVANDIFTIIQCMESLIDDFLTVLAESTSIDFSYSVK